MSAPDRPTREQVDAELARVDDKFVCNDDGHRLLAGEVRALRADVERLRGRTHQIQEQEMAKRAHLDSLIAEMRARWDAAKRWTEDAGLLAKWAHGEGKAYPFWSMTSMHERDVLARLIGERDEARAALVARTPQSAEPEATERSSRLLRMRQALHEMLGFPQHIGFIADDEQLLDSVRVRITPAPVPAIPDGEGRQADADLDGRPLQPVTEALLVQAGEQLLRAVAPHDHPARQAIADVADWLRGNLGAPGTGWPVRAVLVSAPEGEDEHRTDTELWVEDWSWSQVPPPLLAVAPTKPGDTHITLGVADPANGVGEDGALDWTPRRLTAEQAVQLANALLGRARVMHSGLIPQHAAGCQDYDEDGAGSCVAGCPVRAAALALPTETQK